MDLPVAVHATFTSLLKLKIDFFLMYQYFVIFIFGLAYFTVL
jgi:hypothetical protein